MAEIKKIHYNSGQLKHRMPLKDGKHHGTGTWYYRDGKPEHEYQYINGNPHGIWKWWKRSGELDMKRYYLYGLRVDEEEYRKHQLIEKLAGVDEKIK